jgi:2-oxo-hept-3-ene-1,7-dioate hydratase
MADAIQREETPAMMSEADRQRATVALLAAEEARQPMAQLSKTWPDITLDDAYAVQDALIRRKVAAGAKVVGYKIGLTSKAMQAASQIDEPDYGHLLDTMMIPDGAKIPHANYCAPRIEIELVFVLNQDLMGPGIGLMEVMRATEYVVPAMELVDARVRNPRKIFDTVADNGAAAGLIIGGRPLKPFDLDLRWVGGALYRNADIEETGLALGVMGHPALGIAWLANRFGHHGISLPAGQIMLSGSFIRAIWVHKGDTIHADFGPLGGLAVQFV